MRVLLDFAIVLFVVNAFVMGLGFLGELIDPTSTFIQVSFHWPSLSLLLCLSTSFFVIQLHLTVHNPQLFPGGSYIAQYLMFRAYCFGGLMFCALLGVVGLFVCCYGCCCVSSRDRIDTVSSPWYFVSSNQIFLKSSENVCLCLVPVVGNQMLLFLLFCLVWTVLRSRFWLLLGTVVYFLLSSSLFIISFDLTWTLISFWLCLSRASTTEMLLWWLWWWTWYFNSFIVFIDDNKWYMTSLRM